MLRAAALSAETLASVLEQSGDCVKLLRPDGTVMWMNHNGQCAMEIDDFCSVDGRPWADMWPPEAQAAIAAALSRAASGQTVRFDAFCPTARGTPRWWNISVSPVSDTDGKPAGYLAISRDITEAENGRQALEIAIAEMRHRLRNTYAMIGSLLIGFARGQPEHERFARDMTERLISLSTAQTLFSSSDAPCMIAELIPALVAPFDSPNCPVMVESLPAAMVTRGQADAIALVLGELAVNSAKHGALAAGGSLRVAAATLADQVEIKWIERSVAAVAAHTRPQGQGLNLIDRIVRARKGSLAIDWQSHGLTVTLGFALG